VLLEIGRERVAAGVTEEQLLLEAEELVADAMNPNEPPPRRAKPKAGVPGQAALAGIR
jgi:hypothetical protein